MVTKEEGYASDRCQPFCSCGAQNLNESLKHGPQILRELARIVTEMFRGTELEDTTVVAFADSQQANKAKKKWYGAFGGKIIVLDAKQKKAKTSGGGGFGECLALLGRSCLVQQHSSFPERGAVHERRRRRRRPAHPRSLTVPRCCLSLGRRPSS